LIQDDGQLRKAPHPSLNDFLERAGQLDCNGIGLDVTAQIPDAIGKLHAVVDDRHRVHRAEGL
jgi:hypothetical protein